MTKTIALLVPDPGYGERWEPHVGQLTELLDAKLDVRVLVRCWRDDPDVLRRADIVLPLFAWGYQHFVGEWYALLDWLEAEKLNVHNPVTLMRWNTDKAYLRELSAKGVPTVETLWAESLGKSDLAAARVQFGREGVLVKPPISGGSYGTYILHPGEAIPADVAGKPMMVQPLLNAVHDEGEYSLFYFDGVFSHALRKVPKPGDFRVQEQFGASEIEVEPDAEARGLAEQTLAALESAPLYARVDLLRNNQGELVLLELEVIEPSLFLNCTHDGGAAFAEAVGRRLDN